MKAYSYNGWAGCVELRRNRVTGTLVGVYHAEQARLCAEAGPWVTVCEDHGTTINHASLRAARHHAAAPHDWCETCQEEHYG